MHHRAIWIGLFVAAGVLSGTANWVIDAAFYPWALAEPPLLDRWAGTFTTATGDQLTAHLDLHRTNARAATGLPCATCDQIAGTATTCDSRGELRRYRITGSPLDRHGRLIQLTATAEIFPVPDGLELQALVGAWNGGDELTMNADYVIRRQVGHRPASDVASSQRTAVQMQRDRGDETGEDCWR